jgi:hypothetical protein
MVSSPALLAMLSALRVVASDAVDLHALNGRQVIERITQQLLLEQVCSNDIGMLQ